MILGEGEMMEISTNSSIASEPTATYRKSSGDELTKLSDAILNFSETDKTRTENESRLITIIENLTKRQEAFDVSK